LRWPGSAIRAALWPPSCVQLGRSAEPAKNWPLQASLESRMGFVHRAVETCHGRWPGERRVECRRRRCPGRRSARHSRTEEVTTPALAPRTRADTNAGLGTADHVRLASRHIRVFGRESGWLADGRGHATPSAWQRVVETWFADTYLTCWIDQARRRPRAARRHRGRVLREDAPVAPAEGLRGPRRACCPV
jgi:hypothetical protein